MRVFLQFGKAVAVAAGIILSNIGTAADLVDLPGISVHTKGLGIKGKFVFFYSDGRHHDGSGNVEGAIYSIDLVNGDLRKIVDAPSGMFYSSKLGNVFTIKTNSNHSNHTTSKLWTYNADSSKLFNTEFQGTVG